MIKINRIGKCISKNFTHKYYDKLSVGLNFIAKDLLDILKERRLPWDQATGFDGSAAVGDFFPKTDFLKHTIVSLKLNEKIFYSFPFSGIEKKISNSIHLVSRYFTLKIGDILSVQLSNYISVSPNDNIELELDKSKVLFIDIN
jgi:2-keto-4-pentenoate hydratase/2-oxohepta-3-ene-1,7-dioic acid hydratase in catechol pathway